MLIERSYLLCRAGLEDDFIAVMADAGVPLLRALPGARAVRFGRGVEAPGKFMLLIEWGSMDAHVAFTTTPAFQRFLALLKPFSEGGSMEHFEMN